MASYVLVLGHPGEPTGDGISPAQALTSLGAEVRERNLWDDPEDLVCDGDAPSVLLFEAGERPDLAAAALRALRDAPELVSTPALLAVRPRLLGALDPAWGFDDFIVLPCVPAELYTRIRWLEWAQSEFANDERVKVGDLVIDRAAHEVRVNGTLIGLTAKEYTLLSFFAQHRGRVFSRDQLLARVWGSRYEGGPRTVDIHVRRLRMKIGDALPLETMRGAGYKLRAPNERSAEPRRKRGLK